MLNVTELLDGHPLCTRMDSSKSLSTTAIPLKGPAAAAQPREPHLVHKNMGHPTCARFAS
eukprot:8997859-Prorocentrum_lima.AAC.1